MKPNMKRYEFIMYPPKSTIRCKNSCYAVDENHIVNDLFIGQMLACGWTIDTKTIKQID